MAGGQGVEEVALEVGAGVGQGAEPGEVGGSVSASLPWLGVAGCQVQEGLQDTVAVEVEGFVLVVEAHQALVAGDLAGGFLVVSLVVEVAALQGFSCGSRDGFGLLDEAAEDSGTRPREPSPPAPRAAAPPPAARPFALHAVKPPLPLGHRYR